MLKRKSKEVTHINAPDYSGMEAAVMPRDQLAGYGRQIDKQVKGQIGQIKEEAASKIDQQKRFRKAEKVRAKGVVEAGEAYNARNEQANAIESGESRGIGLKGPLLGLAGVAASVFVASKFLPDVEFKEVANGLTATPASGHLVQYAAGSNRDAAINAAKDANRDVCIVNGDSLPFKIVSGNSFESKAQADAVADLAGGMVIPASKCDQKLEF